MPLPRIVLLIAMLLILAGCGKQADQDPSQLYEVVLKEFPAAKKEEVVYLFIEGKDPPPELLKTLRKTMPNLEPGSKVPKGKAMRIDFSDIMLKMDGAELKATISNGIDGKSQRFFLMRKKGKWVVEKTSLEAIS